jgi:ubiquinone/menaquinone biosynthesis C-methylase UbiE
MLDTLYIRFKSLLPRALRTQLSKINQTLFARNYLQRKYGVWFNVDWRKEYKTMSNEEWIRAYDSAWHHHHNDCVDETDASMILSALGTPGTVLEVGCGAGTLAVQMAQAGCTVSAADVSLEAIRIAQETAQRAGVEIIFHHAFAEELPFADQSFDYITCCHTLEHVRDLKATVAHLKRIARKRIVILVPRQEFRLYMSNYHTQFFATPDDMIRAMNMQYYDCRIISARADDSEYQGDMILFVGYCQKP